MGDATCSHEEGQGGGESGDPSAWGDAPPCVGVGTPSPPYVRCSVQSLWCPANSRDLGKQLVGITHGFLHKFLGTARRQRSQEGWAHREDVGVRSPRLGAGDRVRLSLSPGTQWERPSWRPLTLVLRCPQLCSTSPGTSLSAPGQVPPELLDLAVLHAQHAAQQLHHVVLKLVIVQPGEDTRKERK